MNQNEINNNLARTFDLGLPVVAESQPDVDGQRNNNQILQKKKSSGRGGARPNAGRKVGSYVKLSATDVLAEIAKRDVPFAVGLAEDYIKARQSGDMHVIQKYQQMLLAKVIADKTETEITSGGQPLGVQLVFTSKELPDWQK
jgi:hypothetical protein